MHPRRVPTAKSLPFYVLSALVGTLLAAEVRTILAATEVKPLLAVVVRSIWHPLHGHESPTLVIYDDGIIICSRTKDPDDSPFQSFSVADPHAASAEILGSGCEQAKESYMLTVGTDNPTTVFWTPEKVVWAYGLRWGPRESWEHGSDDNPAGLRDATRRVIAWREKTGTPWLPDRIEMWFDDFDFRFDKVPEWPADWPQPDFESPSLIRGGWHCVKLPAEHFRAIRKLLPERSTSRDAFIRVGKKCVRTAHRVPFPGEAAWVDAGQHY